MIRGAEESKDLRDTMGNKLITIDDITGEQIEEGDGEHITFSVQGVDYEMDLTKENAEKFHEAMALYTEKANPVVAAPPTPRQATKPQVQANKRDPEELKAIRTWARANGHELSDRGRISAEIQAAYDEAHKTA